MKWFGEDWGADLCKSVPHVSTPVGEECGRCEEPIEEGDNGVIVPCLLEVGTSVNLPYHLNCHLRAIIGSVAHIERRCGCYIPGATDTDDPALTKREAADAAVEAWRKQL